MDPRSEIRDFLTSRRARITPQDVGLKVFGPRRVPGLRREEVATLAGLSVDYYNRLERGNLGGASEPTRWAGTGDNGRAPRRSGRVRPDGGSTQEPLRLSGGTEWRSGSKPGLC